MPERLFHVAEAEHWTTACRTGRYDRSTRGLSLAEVGFVHLATDEQWPGVLERYYTGHEGPLVLLTIDPSRLTAPLRWEDAPRGAGEPFPHLYGPLELDAVVTARPLARQERRVGWRAPVTDA
jgi:uncharacterized protein (DUF952 family)